MVDEGILAMSTRERDRLRVIEAVCDRRMKQGQAGERLGLSVRQIKRLVRAYRHHGARALISARRGRPSNRRIRAGVSEILCASRLMKLLAWHESLFELDGELRLGSMP